MRFEKKIFISILVPLLFTVVALSIWTYYDTSSRIQSEYVDRYNSLNTVLVTSFKEMDLNAEKISKNAARTLFHIEKTKGLPSNEQLIALAKDLSVTHFYVTDKDGVFIRNTDFPVEEELPKLFDFCDDYRGLLTGAFSIQQTPILPTAPYRGPFKFTMIPNHNKTRIIEVGYHMSYVADILRDVIQSNPNINRIGLFSPSGFELGSMSVDGRLSHGKTIKSPDVNIGQPEFSKEEVSLRSTIPVSSTHCCECKVKNITSADGDYFYILKTDVSLTPLKQSLASIQKQVSIVLFIMSLLALWLSKKLSQRLVKALRKIDDGVNEVITTNDLSKRIEVAGSDEFSNLAKNFNRMISTLKKSQESLVESEKNKALAEVSMQVAHDIRSPLSALNMISSSLVGVPEERRLIIRNATQRINDIANSLLQKGKSSSGSTPTVRAGAPGDSEPVMLSALIDAVVSEKRVQYREKPEIEIQADFSKGYGLFAKIDPTDFARVISNLVNNSVEALTGPGQIIIAIGGDRDLVQISVCDTGHGISQEILSKIKSQRVSHGKDDPASGSGLGLGLYHARQTAKAAGGELSIHSQEGQGTKVTLILPRATTPSWFVEKILLTPQITVVSVDDDQTIHQIWAGRISSATRPDMGIRHLSFYSIDRIEEWIHLHQTTSALFLVDYEFLGQKGNGLDIIERAGIQKNSILVTSRYEEAHVRDRAKSIGVKIIPKSLAPFVPIVTNLSRQKYDAILIDDDPLVHSTWKIFANEKQKKLLCFSTPDEFFAKADDIHRSTPLYIDVNLGHGINGQDVAEKAAAMGFSNIALATGYDPDSLTPPICVMKVVTKDPVF